jgi:uncharacterized protein
MRSKLALLDPIYGEISFDESMTDLIVRPAVQRLRDIRLSNIDSLSMPGIANISRYEHALGTAYLSTRLAFVRHIDRMEALVVQAAALLHDSAISAFGHLVEEALSYNKVKFNHENKLATLLSGDSDLEVGGIDLQLYAGRESGIGMWAKKTFGAAAEKTLTAITMAMNGEGRFGRCIAGTIDVDNLDNVARIAFHMGLDFDRGLPIKIASSVIGCENDHGLTFSKDAIGLVEDWLILRNRVYTKLMLSRSDFAGKAMLIYCIATAYKNGNLGDEGEVWRFTDRDLITRLLRCNDAEVVRAVQSWLLHDLWPVSDLLWMSGSVPKYHSVSKFSELATQQLKRPCFAYAISDKRTRHLQIRFESGEITDVGAPPATWLLGVVSKKRKTFTVQENRKLQTLASEYFGSRCLGEASEAAAEPLLSFA